MTEHARETAKEPGTPDSASTRPHCEQPAAMGAARARESLRITYWTGWLSPEMEGLSKEVFALKRSFPRSRIFGLSNGYLVRLSTRQRYVGLHARFYPLFRLLAPLWDVTSDVNHIYGNLGEWFFLRALRRRPMVMTVASYPVALEMAMYRYVAQFVTHAPSATKRLVELGFDAARVTQIPPGVDLVRFTPEPRSEDPPIPGVPAGRDRFRVLFATTPHVPDGVRARGVALMMEAAASLPDVDFLMLWRPLPGAAALIAKCRRDAPRNVHISSAIIGDMTRIFRACDATIAPFVDAIGMKTCPTSLIESLACGRPVLVSTQVGMSDLVRDEGCGEVFAPTVSGLMTAIARLRASYADYAKLSRACAERHFSVDDCRRRHEALYAHVVANHAPSGKVPPSC